MPHVNDAPPSSKLQPCYPACSSCSHSTMLPLVLENCYDTFKYKHINEACDTVCKKSSAVYRSSHVPLARTLDISCYDNTKRACNPSYRRLVVLAARNRRDQNRSSSGRPVRPAATDAAGLLRALTQLASSTTILVGSHQAYVSDIGRSVELRTRIVP